MKLLREKIKKLFKEGKNSVEVKYAIEYEIWRTIYSVEKELEKELEKNGKV